MEARSTPMSRSWDFMGIPDSRPEKPGNFVFVLLNCYPETHFMPFTNIFLIQTTNLKGKHCYLYFTYTETEKLK
jgi:hypothetical protein